MIMKTKKFDRSRFLDYYKRADEFFNAMKDEKEFERYYASALLGIHASIALTDSLTIYESGKRATDTQHIDAVKLLNIVCKTRGINKDGPNRLGKILSKKNFVAYGKRFRSMDTNELNSIRLNVERLFVWAYKNFDYLGKKIREGG